MTKNECILKLKLLGIDVVSHWKKKGSRRIFVRIEWHNPLDLPEAGIDFNARRWGSVYSSVSKHVNAEREALKKLLDEGWLP